MDNKPPYTIPRFGKILGPSRNAIFRELRDSRLKAVTIGRRTMIRTADAWLKRLQAYQPSNVV